jgi:hypothetical protein
MATANFSTLRTIHEDQSFEIVSLLSETYNRKATNGNPSLFRHFASQATPC